MKIDFFRPILFYKKYLLAHRILKESCGQFIWMENSPDEPLYHTGKLFMKINIAQWFAIPNPVNTFRLIEAIDVLEKNKHIIAYRNQNLYEFFIEPTSEGERAFNDGFYYKGLYKFVYIAIGTPIVGTLLVYLLKKLG